MGHPKLLLPVLQGSPSGLDSPTLYFEDQPVLQRIRIHPDVIAVQHLAIQNLDR
jgi:hypothetical protein